MPGFAAMFSGDISARPMATLLGAAPISIHAA
jgi:hypothetical protein